MTKTIATTRRVKPAAEEEKKVEVASTEPAEAKAAPKVKRMAEPAPVEKKQTAPAPKLRAAVVELIEGSTYEFHGMRFSFRRPVVVTDQRILSALSVNSRFKVTGVEGGEK